MISAEVRSIDNLFVHAAITSYAGNAIQQPEKFAPRLDLLAYHREHIFVG